MVMNKLYEYSLVPPLTTGITDSSEFDHILLHPFYWFLLRFASFSFLTNPYNAKAKKLCFSKVIYRIDALRRGSEGFAIKKEGISTFHQHTSYLSHLGTSTRHGTTRAGEPRSYHAVVPYADVSTDSIQALFVKGRGRSETHSSCHHHYPSSYAALIWRGKDPVDPLCDLHPFHHHHYS